MNRRYLVTGGAGFIGSRLVAHLLSQGHLVSVYDDFSTGVLDRLRGLSQQARLNVCTGDLCDRSRLSQCMRGMDGVFHLAAVVSVADCTKDWLEGHKINATGTLGLFDLVAKTSPVPIVYASSAAVYGDAGRQPCHEDMPERPISPYGADKVSAEHHARAFWDIHRVPSIGLRFFNVYGKGQSLTSPYAGVLARFASNLMTGAPLQIHGDGLQSRDFVYAGDAVIALAAAMNRLEGRAESFVCNVCSGSASTVWDVANALAEAFGSTRFGTRFLPARPGDIRYSLGDPARMQQMLGLRPFVPLADRLPEWAEWSAKTRQAS